MRCGNHCLATPVAMWCSLQWRHMSPTASQITQRLVQQFVQFNSKEHLSSRLPALCEGIQHYPVDFSHQEYVMHKTLPWHDVIIISHDMLPSVYLSENKYISLHKAIYHMHVFSTPIPIMLKQTHKPSRCDNQIAHSYHLGQPGEATIWLLPCLLIKMRYKCYAFSPYPIMISIFYNSNLQP